MTVNNKRVGIMVEWSNDRMVGASAQLYCILNQIGLYNSLNNIMNIGYFLVNNFIEKHPKVALYTSVGSFSL